MNLYVCRIENNSAPMEKKVNLFPDNNYLFFMLSNVNAVKVIAEEVKEQVKKIYSEVYTDEYTNRFVFRERTDEVGNLLSTDSFISFWFGIEGGVTAHTEGRFFVYRAERPTNIEV